MYSPLVVTNFFTFLLLQHNYPKVLLYLTICQIQPATNKYINLSKFNKKISPNGYIVFYFKELTIKLSAKFTVQIFIKANLLRSIAKLPSHFRSFVNYVTRVSGVRIGKFHFKFTNIVCGCKINFHTLEQQFGVVKRMHEKKIVTHYFTTDTQAYIQCYSEFGAYQLRKRSIRFIGNSFDNIEKLLQSTLPYFVVN